MYWNFKQIIETLSKGNNYRLLAGSKHGLERECLRITKKGKLATTPHPKYLGSALTNPYITTDFSEAQLELVTPAFNSEEETLKFLEDIHLFVNKNLGSELLWPFSMPCRLPSEKHIPLAQYGKSYTGRKKTLYRLGLAYRYGRKMQTVSGTHYNFSFSDRFWDFLYDKFGRKHPSHNLTSFISASYLGLIRNFLRYGWLNTYLFGASPVLDKSYLKKKHPALPHATSFRMSELGYYSKIQKQLAISFNSLDDYIMDLKRAISTPDPAYKELPGLNENILQIENEHYSRIRPKQILKDGETPTAALAARGIKYIEIRAVDINPFPPVGLTIDQLCFLHVFAVYCLFRPGPFLTLKEQQYLTEKQNKVAFYGRDPALSLKNEARKLLLEMTPVADLMDKNFFTKRYKASLEMQMNKLTDPGLLPSAIILEEMKKRKKSFIKFGLQLAQDNKKLLSGKTLAKSLKEKFKQIAKQSLIDQENLEIKEETLLPEHEDMEVSTQILIKEAQKRGIQVGILDRKENFIRLKKGKKIEYVKQATKTSKDSYITYLIMENKHVSKEILAGSGLHVPGGELFSDPKEAISSYNQKESQFPKIKIVVKPNLTNFGIGVSFVNPHSPDSFKQAVFEAFKHGESIVVEEFISGEEYRFLTINYKTVSVLNRIPANITGDGIHNIRELMKIKNEDPRNYKFFNDYYLRAGKVEAQHLRSQNLTFKSVPKKGQQIFLRTNSNVSTGGDPIDVTDQVPKKYKKIAEIAARAANARICGIDMIIGGNLDRQTGLGSVHQATSAVDYAIIEINFNPALQMHEYPVKGKRCKVADKVLDLMGF